MGNLFTSLSLAGTSAGDNRITGDYEKIYSDMSLQRDSACCLVPASTGAHDRRVGSYPAILPN